MRDATQREKNVMSDLVGDLMTGFKNHHIYNGLWWCSNRHLRVRAQRVVSLVMARNYVGENIQVVVPERVGCSWDAAVDYRCNEFSVVVMAPDTYPRDRASVTFEQNMTVRSYTPR